MQQLHQRTRFYLQCLGAIALATALLFHRPGFDFIWFLFALLVAVGLPLINVWIGSAFNAIRRRPPQHRIPANDYHPAQKYLVAMEDGVFLVPLLWIGITPLTATVTAVLYALFGCCRQNLSMVITRSVAYFVLILWVLPNGLWMVVAAHLIAELAIRYLFPYWFSVTPVAQQEAG